MVEFVKLRKSSRRQKKKRLGQKIRRRNYRRSISKSWHLLFRSLKQKTMKTKVKQSRKQKERLRIFKTKGLPNAQQEQRNNSSAFIVKFQNTRDQKILRDSNKKTVSPLQGKRIQLASDFWSKTTVAIMQQNKVFKSLESRLFYNLEFYIKPNKHLNVKLIKSVLDI